MFDVVVVGARCAGAATALLLARRGYRVLIVDRAAFPSDTLSSHYIQPPGVRRLERWGLLQPLEATGAPPQPQMTFDFGPFAVTGRPLTEDGSSAVGYGPRRTRFDKMLVGAALEAGAQLEEGATLRSLLWHEDRAAGVRVLCRSGRESEIAARIVVGADGRRSTVARLTGALEYNIRPAATCNYFSYWQDFEIEHLRLIARPGRFFIAMPTNDGATCLVVVRPIAEFDRVRADFVSEYERELRTVPWIAERLARARRVERVYGTADLRNFYRLPHGPGWALVGDAGYHRDPITAQGMSDALGHAELLAEAVDRGLSGLQDMNAALRDYEKRRNEQVAAMYDMTCSLARLEPPPPAMQGLLATLPGNQSGIDRFLGASSGTLPVSAFFGPPAVSAA